MTILSNFQNLKLEIEGADEKLIRSNHFENYSDLFLDGKISSDSNLIPFFISNHPSHYTTICHRYYGKENIHDQHDLDKFNIINKEDPSALVAEEAQVVDEIGVSIALNDMISKLN